MSGNSPETGIAEEKWGNAKGIAATNIWGHTHGDTIQLSGPYTFTTTSNAIISTTSSEEGA